MSKNSNGKTAVLFLLSAGLILAAAATYLLSFYYRQVCFHILGGFCQRMIEKNPDSMQVVLELLKNTGFPYRRRSYLVRLWLSSVKFGDQGYHSLLGCCYSIFRRGHTVLFFLPLLARKVRGPYPGIDGISGKNQYRPSGIAS